MKFTCDRCDAQYMISDEKVGPNGVKVRCKKCSHVILVRRTENGAAGGEMPAPVVAGPAPTGEGLEAELGQAFDNAFGGSPPGAEPSAEAAPDGAPKADLESTQAVSPEEAAKLAARSAPPEPAATEWYVAIGQAQVGPLPLAEVRRKWEAGDIGPDSLVWRPGMGDWAALSGVSDLAAYLAPVPRGAVRPKPSPTPAPVSAARSPFGSMPAAGPGPQGARHEVAWKPSGASALAALASEELSSQPEGRPEPKPMVTAKSLMDGLPDGGGVDPTGAIPLQIKALEETGEQPAKSSVARGAEKLRKKRSSTRALVAIIVLLLLVLGAGAGFVFKDRLLAVVGPAPTVAQLPPDKPTPAAAVRPTPQPKPTEAAATGTGSPAATATAEPAPTEPRAAEPQAEPRPAEPKAAEPKPTEAKAEPRPEPKAAPAKPEPKAVAAREEKAKPEPRATHAREKKPAPTRVARAEEATPPQAPPAKKKGDLLDFDGGGDAALDEALGKTSNGRSVYVPPAPGGGGGVPERVTDSQVNETIMTRVSALQQCLADKGGSGGGVLKMRWSISPEGAVQNLKCITPESASTPFASCVTGVLKGLRFPKSEKGRQDVTFPFKF